MKKEFRGLICFVLIISMFMAFAGCNKDTDVDATTVEPKTTKSEKTTKKEIETTVVTDEQGNTQVFEVVTDKKTGEKTTKEYKTSTTTQQATTEPTQAPTNTTNNSTTGNTTTKKQTTTKAPVTQPPATKPPVTQPPATKPPVTQPPATQPPVTQPPVQPTAPPSNYIDENTKLYIENQVYAKCDELGIRYNRANTNPNGSKQAFPCGVNEWEKNINELTNDYLPKMQKFMHTNYIILEWVTENGKWYLQVYHYQF